jgi:hypothetical protein
MILSERCVVLEDETYRLQLDLAVEGLGLER